MSIDRHNYEELFLLYVDNELSEEQRREVEEFAARNPDLKEELELLCQHRLVPDAEIRFPDHQSLLREKAPAFPDLQNYQDWMLLYVDRELNESQVRDFEHFLRLHPALQQEADLLLRTRLVPESVSFPAKKTLYRRSAPVRRMAPVLRRVAAAVILLLLGGATVILLTRGSGNGQQGEVAKSNTRPITIPSIRQNPVIRDEQPSPDEQQSIKVQDTKLARQEERKKPNIVETPTAEEQPIALNRHRDNELPVPVENPNLKETDSGISEMNRVDEPRTPTVSNEVVTNSASEPSNFMTASFSEPVEQSDGKKNRLRGLLRKVTRTFEKTTQVKATDENETLLVGGLAIKLK